MNRRLGLFAIPAAVAASAAAASAVAFRREPVYRATGFVREVDRALVHYFDEGQGPAVVLVHGFGGSAFSWRFVRPALGEAFRVITLDLPGFGWSDRRHTVPLSHRAHARRIVHLLDELGIERAVFAGHSMGGGVLEYLAEQDPDRVHGLALVAAMNSAERERNRERRVRARPFIRFGITIGSRGPGGRLMFAHGLRRLVANPAVVTPEMVEGYLQPLQRSGTYDCIVAMGEQTAKEPPPDLARITAPTIVLSGDQDRLFSVADGQRLAASIPGARHFVIAPAGHLIPEEQPAEVAEHIRSLWAQ